MSQILKNWNNIVEENEILKAKVQMLEYNLNESYQTIDGMAKTIRQLEDERGE
jgi:hypothetical protein